MGLEGKRLGSPVRGPRPTAKTTIRSCDLATIVRRTRRRSCEVYKSTSLLVNFGRPLSRRPQVREACVPAQGLRRSCAGLRRPLKFILFPFSIAARPPRAPGQHGVAPQYSPRLVALRFPPFVRELCAILGVSREFQGSFIKPPYMSCAGPAWPDVLRRAPAQVLRRSCATTRTATLATTESRPPPRRRDAVPFGRSGSRPPRRRREWGRAPPRLRAIVVVPPSAAVASIRPRRPSAVVASPPSARGPPLRGRRLAASPSCRPRGGPRLACRRTPPAEHLRVIRRPGLRRNKFFIEK